MLREEAQAEDGERARERNPQGGGAADRLRPGGAFPGPAHRGGRGDAEIHRDGEGVRRHDLHQELLRLLPPRRGPAVPVQTVPAEDGASEGRRAGGQELETLQTTVVTCNVGDFLILSQLHLLLVELGQPQFLLFSLADEKIHHED